jgi:DNA-binding response OmpR family regulator
MMRPSILIVHPDRKAQRTMQRVLGSTGYAVEVLEDLAAARAQLDGLAPVLVIVDGSLLSPEAADLISAARARGVEACMTLLGHGEDKLPAILTMGSITNLLSHAMPVLADELTITVQKLIRRDLFGAEKYLLWGTHLHEVTLERASQRHAVVGELGEQVKARGQAARVASMAMLVADELISNAVHNAPVDADGVHYRRDLARDQELPLDARHRVRLRWGCDARYLAIEVRDPFGSLSRDTILASLAKDAVRETGSGAGMGVALAYRSSDHLVFNIHPGTCTEIIALIDVRNPPTERAGASSYNIFVERTQ